jgi:peroxiredoxin
MRFHFLPNLIAVYVLFSYSALKADSLPQYRLSIGQELTYVSGGSFNYDGGVLNSGSTDIYDVVAKNPDGSWHVIARLSQWESQGNGPAQPETELIGFDLRPDGTLILPATDSPEREMPPDFPLLPADPSQLAGSWQRAQQYGAQITCKSLPPTHPGMFEFTADRVDPIDRIYLMAHKTRFQFDPARGLLLSALTTDSQGYGFVGKGESDCKLTSDTDKPKKWLDQFSADCNAYFAAESKTGDLLTKAESDPAQCDALFAQAKDILSATQKQAVTPEVVDLFSKQIADLDGQEQYTKQEAQTRQSILNKPAAAWTLDDLSGSKHSLDDYRGKVVVLDFWYRGCGWCMRAMPEMKSLAADFSAKPVAVLGMNTDTDPADARFVVNAFGLNYPILHVGQDLVQQYGVQGFPTVFVIGPDGVIRDMEVGYSPTLHDTLAAKITELINAK